MNHVRFKTQRRSQDRGAVLVCVIVCVAIATLLLAGMLKNTLLTRRQIRTERHARQTEWLVQAGAERAAFRLASDAEYNGERWALSADAMAGADSGVVTISVNHDQEDHARVQVIAEYPSDNVFSIRRTREFLIDLPQNQ